MDLIYHGSITKNIDGTKKLIVAGEKGLVPIDRCFLKNPQGVKKMPDKIKKLYQKRANCEQNGLRHLHATKTMDRLLGVCDRTNRQLILCLTLLLLLLLFIVNNGNVLTITEHMKENILEGNRMICNFFI